jgi:hypothetical protein
MATPRLEPDVEQELIECERQYWKALQEHDTAKAVELTDFPCLLTGPMGAQRVDKERYIQMMEGWKDTIRRADMKNILVEHLSDDVAIIAYQVHEEIMVDGKTVTLDASDCSTWIRRDGHWACAAHCESIAGDHYGRDKRPN